MKHAILLSCAALSLFAVDASIQDIGVNIDVNGQKLTIKREIKDICYDEVTMSANSVWGGDYAASTVPNDCKKTFATTVGNISPFKIQNTTTVGELETMEFIQKMSKESNRYILVDSRTKAWYNTGTIAGATNLPFVYFVQNKKFTQELEDALIKLGAKKTDSGYDFSEAKTALFFCNGIWCGQSPQAINKLIALGYPQDKILWYRGGMQDWRSVGLSVYMPPKK